MVNLEKYQQVFIANLEVSVDEVAELKYQGTDLWDSVGHMNLIAAVEDAFDIMMETDDIIEFSSYEKGLDILKNKYGISF